jgi:hypothetical protein
MKLNSMAEVLLLILMIFSISACSVFSVSNRGAKVTVESKPKQPNVIVNQNVKKNLSED